MTFFASRRNGAVEQQGGPSSTGIVASEPTGLPPWVESAVKKLLASVLPQFQPLVDKTEIVLADARETLAQQRKDQLAVLHALAELRETVETLAARVAAMHATVAVARVELEIDEETELARSDTAYQAPGSRLIKRGVRR